MPQVLIAGRDALAAGVARELHHRGVAVARLDRAAYELEGEDLEGSAVLVLAADDDGGNVSLALRARKLVPDLAIVVRLFDSALVRYLGETLPGVRIMSMSAVTAPVFAEAAKKALARPAVTPPPSRFETEFRRARRFRIDPILVGALVAFFLLVFPSAAFFAHALGIRYMDALYFVWTTVMTVGYGDIALKDASDGVKLFGMLLMLAGAGFIAVLFAILSDWVLSRRLDMLNGLTPERGRGHIIVAGAGNIGFRVCELLAPLHHRLVVIERETRSHNGSALAAAGHHVILADATNESTFDIAGLKAASVVLALTDSDAVNMQVALQARRHAVPVVMRADSAELAAHMVERGDAIAFSPVSAATIAFCDAAMEAL